MDLRELREVIKALKPPEKYHTGIYVVFGAILIIIFASFVVNPTLQLEKDSELCGPATMEGRCYRMHSSVCKKAWDKFKDDCEFEIKRDLGDKNATSLMGPPVKKCTKLKFDKAMFYTRKNERDAPCDAYFESLGRGRVPGSR